MQSTDQEVVETALERLDRGVTLVTVLRTWGSSPRPAGSIMVVCDDGALRGSVSGGCVEEDLVARLATKDIDIQGPTRLRYGEDDAQRRRLALPCGGILELLLEPLHDTPATRRELQQLHTAMRERRRLTRELDLVDGTRRVLEDDGAAFEYNERRLRRVFGPRWRALIIGAGETSRYLADMARALDYQIIVCDPREDYARAWDLPGTRLDTQMPDDAVKALKPDAHTLIVALTHDPKLDDMALLEALTSQAFYVGALGSRRNNQKRRQRLLEMGLHADAVARLHGPVGLALGGNTPPEIALAVLAEVTALRHGVELVPATQAIEPRTASIARP